MVAIPGLVLAWENCEDDDFRLRRIDDIKTTSILVNLIFVRLLNLFNQPDTVPQFQVEGFLSIAIHDANTEMV